MSQMQHQAAAHHVLHQASRPAKSHSLAAGSAVLALRAELQMTQTEFAALIGRRKAALRRIESGTVNVSVKTLKEIAQAAHRQLNISFDK